MKRAQKSRNHASKFLRSTIRVKIITQLLQSRDPVLTAPRNVFSVPGFMSFGSTITTDSPQQRQQASTSAVQQPAQQQSSQQQPFQQQLAKQQPEYEMVSAHIPTTIGDEGMDIKEEDEVIVLLYI